MLIWPTSLLYNSCTSHTLSLSIWNESIIWTMSKPYIWNLTSSRPPLKIYYQETSNNWMLLVTNAGTIIEQACYTWYRSYCKIKPITAQATIGSHDKLIFTLALEEGHAMGRAISSSYLRISSLVYHKQKFAEPVKGYT